MIEKKSEHDTKLEREPVKSKTDKDAELKAAAEESLWRSYRARGTVEARPYAEDMELPKDCLIGAADKKAGSPKLGDWLLRTRDNREGVWLVNGQHFVENYEP